MPTKQQWKVTRRRKRKAERDARIQSLGGRRQRQLTVRLLVQTTDIRQPEFVKAVELAAKDCGHIILLESEFADVELDAMCVYAGLRGVKIVCDKKDYSKREIERLTIYARHHKLQLGWVETGGITDVLTGEVHRNQSVVLYGRQVD